MNRRYFEPVREKEIFNLSPPLRSFIGRQEELDNLHRLVLLEHRPATITRVTTIFGLGGVGKSELARVYCHQHTDFFKNILFFNLENRQAIEETVQRLAEKLNIQLFCTYAGENKPFIDVLMEVYKYFDQEERCLIVLDNVEHYRAARDFIPRREHFYTKPYILITSRSQEWDVGEEGDIEQLYLKPFQKSEAEGYVEQNLLAKAEKQAVEKLAFELHYFPLALRQAVSYINLKNKEGIEFKIEDFLQLYYVDKLAILENYIDDNNYLYNHTLFTIWEETLQKIFKDEQHGDNSYFIFNIMAYLKSEMEVKFIFLKLNPDEEITWEAIELLSQYSMIDLDKGIVRIDETVQDIARFNLKQAGFEEKILKDALELLEKTSCEKHIVSVWEYSCYYPKLVKSFYHKSVYCEDRVTPLHLLANHKRSIVTIEAIFKCLASDDTHSMDNYIDVDNEDINDETPLYKAASKGYLDVVQFLVSKGARVTIQCGIHNWTALHVAAFNCNKILVKFLLDTCEHLENIKDQYGNVPVDLAAVSGHIDMVNVFKTYGEKHLFFAHMCDALRTSDFDKFHFNLRRAIRQNPYIINQKLVGMTILNFALQQLETRYTILLLKFGASVSTCDNNGRSPLFHAAKDGQSAMLEVLIEYRADIHIVDQFGITPLLTAAENHPDILQLLMSHGANPNRTNTLGSTALHIASEKGNYRVVDVLIAFHANINQLDQYQQTPLHFATKVDSVETVVRLLNNHADVNASDCVGITPLSNAVTFSSLEVVKLLLERGANFEMVDKSNRTALHYAACRGDESIIKHLVQYGADINALDTFGRSPLSYAALKGHVLAVRTIIEHGANPYIADLRDRTPLHDACQHGCYATTRLLVGFGLNPKAVDMSGRTPLHYAVQCNHLNVVMFFIQSVEGTEIDIRDNFGKTPLALAVTHGLFEMVKTLIFSGSDFLADDKIGATPFSIANEANNNDMIAFMLDQSLPRRINI